nr:retrovirus-related Pol polyprotein from transposon TNT 1-94 [Tanacetum cinerariifolium]
MNDKMNDPECVTRKVKISPHDYSKDNFLATFTPQKQLTPEQIFWSNDLMKMKSEDLKEQTKVPTTCVIFELSLRSSSTLRLLIILAVEYSHLGFAAVGSISKQTEHEMSEPVN